MNTEERNFKTPEQHLQLIFKRLDKNDNGDIIITPHERDMMLELLKRI